MPQKQFGLLLAILLLSKLCEAGSVPLGQWIWTHTDVVTFQRLQKKQSSLKSSVSIGELRWEKDAAHFHYRLSPSVVPGSDAWVIRLDDSFHPILDRDPVRMAEELNQQLETLDLLLKKNSKVKIQLDYDCPERLLESWALVLQRLQRADGVLFHRTVWITTLPCHLRHRGFGALMKGKIAGHILQLFDTDLAWSEETELEMATLLQNAALPFAIGIGGFDRPRTDHAAWAHIIERFRKTSNFEGAWIFPASFSWAALLEVFQ